MSATVSDHCNIKVPIDIRFSDDKDGEITLTMRGDVGAIVHAMVNGLPTDALAQLNAALDQALTARKGAPAEAK